MTRPGDAGDRRRAALGTAVFTLVVPGSVVVLVPYLITRWRLGPPLLGIPVVRGLGVLLIVLGLPVFANFILRFVREGIGTPAPIAPTRHLVVGGVFRHVRNPGYIGVVSMIVGQGLLFGNASVLLYALVLAIGFHLFVLLYEEPTLRRTFGAEYEAYCASVPRWLPRLRGPRRPLRRPTDR